MSFITDKQTLNDLNIFGKKGAKSVFNLFNHTRTIGGTELLEQLFNSPSDQPDEINRRTGILRYVCSLQLTFPFRAELIDLTEVYLYHSERRLQIGDSNKIAEKIKGLIGANHAERQLIVSIQAVISLVIQLRKFISTFDQSAYVMSSWAELQEIKEILDIPTYSKFVDERDISKLSNTELNDLDRLFRFSEAAQLQRVLKNVYYLDAIIAIAHTAAIHNLCFPTALPKYQRRITLTGVFHPFLQHPVPNSVQLSERHNVFFLTGANMAGKSTFLKSVGIAVYLAHLGFPVPATKMEFSVFDTMLTTINLADDVNNGYSHFYSEVLRVKKMTEQVSRGEHVFVIFDELFRGTNVKDAYDATVAITDAVDSLQNVMFMVSTHIIEAGEHLLLAHPDINFSYVPTIMVSNKPKYTYTLEKGISEDRHGMLIIKNESILDILANGKKNIK